MASGDPETEIAAARKRPGEADPEAAAALREHERQ